MIYVIQNRRTRIIKNELLHCAIAYNQCSTEVLPTISSRAEAMRGKLFDFLAKPSAKRTRSSTEAQDQDDALDSDLEV
jgi:hypothetical protein